MWVASARLGVHRRGGGDAEVRQRRRNGGGHGVGRTAPLLEQVLLLPRRPLTEGLTK